MLMNLCPLQADSFGEDLRRQRLAACACFLADGTRADLVWLSSSEIGYERHESCGSVWARECCR
jgi:hypothetical protein